MKCIGLNGVLQNPLANSMIDRCCQSCQQGRLGGLLAQLAAHLVLASLSLALSLPSQAAEESVARTKIKQERPTEASETASRKLPFALLGQSIAAGTEERLAWSPSRSFLGTEFTTPVLVISGIASGPTLCLVAAVHGDELNGIQMVQRIVHSLEPDKLSGNVIGIPILNLQGFRRGSRYLPDRRDLNRYFPGNPQGSSAARIAYSFFQEVVRHCDALIDLHTASFHRTNLPQVRANLSQPAVFKLAQGFGAMAILHGRGPLGTLRRAATDAGIPALTLEAGEPMRIQPDEIAHGVRGIRSVMKSLGMVQRTEEQPIAQPMFYHAKWVRTDAGGILLTHVLLGETVDQGQLLGIVTDPITNQRTDLLSPYRGRILGMALNQVVQPGYAAFRIGMQTKDGGIPKAADAKRVVSRSHRSGK